MTSSRFDPGSTSVRPQNPWTSPFYGSINGPGLKTMQNRTLYICKIYYYRSIVISSIKYLKFSVHFPAFCWKIVGQVHCSRDPQILFSAKKTLKLGLTALFTYLKIILLQYFQISIFSKIRGIQTHPK